MLASYFVGQRINPIPYDLRSIFSYVALAAVLVAAMTYIPIEQTWLKAVVHTALLAVYVVFMVRRDFPLGALLSKLKR
jgi:hypothetical protein